ncbi:MAG: glycosyltransferase family 4 protein [Euryarchaeota archaeon]|nr:glycosyltransferase family 4 protein [Euryarchaeota archaeon]
MYPYINDEIWTMPHPVEVEEFSLNQGIGEDDFVVLMVARMDSMKGQDTAIRAVARLKRKIPDIKLVLVGNGSFSGSKKGGLATSKSHAWLAHLQELVRRLKVKRRVIFTGFLNHECIKRAYARSDVVAVPSLVEGFNLTTIEAWVYRKPVVVSTGAGSSELIMDGENGFTHQPRDHKGLAEKLLAVYEGGEDAVHMGERGHDSAKQCLLEEGMKNEWQVLEETAGRF